MEERPLHTLSHDELREVFQWGTYGRNGDEPLRFIYLKEISDNHLVNIINHIKSLNHYDEGRTISYFRNEMVYRELNNISVSDYGKPVNIKLGR
jgi:hypothetical protein